MAGGREPRPPARRRVVAASWREGAAVASIEEGLQPPVGGRDPQPPARRRAVVGGGRGSNVVARGRELQPPAEGGSRRRREVELRKAVRSGCR